MTVSDSMKPRRSRSIVVVRTKVCNGLASLPNLKIYFVVLEIHKFFKNCAMLGSRSVEVVALVRLSTTLPDL